MARKIARLGWLPDVPDARDHLFAMPMTPLEIPAASDLRPHCPPVYDQGELGSCTGNAIAAAIEFDRMRENLPYVFTPSRLFIYYNERVIEGTVPSDSGAMIRDGIKSVAVQGVCPEVLWPYDVNRFADKPSQDCYDSALKDRAVRYYRLVPTPNQLRACLSAGFPFVFGFSVYESFESDQVAQTGVVPMPRPGEAMIGGHAVMAVGHDDASQRFTVRNSWGKAWGMEGYFTIPYAYLTDPNLADDFWTVRFVGA